MVMCGGNACSLCMRRRGRQESTFETRIGLLQLYHIYNNMNKDKVHIVDQELRELEVRQQQKH